jgi:hypothetical protein
LIGYEAARHIWTPALRGPVMAASPFFCPLCRKSGLMHVSFVRRKRLPTNAGPGVVPKGHTGAPPLKRVVEKRREGLTKKVIAAFHEVRGVN